MYIMITKSATSEQSTVSGTRTLRSVMSIRPRDALPVSVAAVLRQDKVLLHGEHRERVMQREHHRHRRGAGLCRKAPVIWR